MAPPSPVKSHSAWRPHPIMQLYRDNQIGIPLSILVAATATTYLSPHHPLSLFVLPSNQVTPSPSTSSSTLSPDTDLLYTKGPADILFVIGSVILWTVLRAIVMDYILRPFAQSLGCRRTLLNRFAEQGWLVIYYLGSFSVGLAFAIRSPYWGNTLHFWTDYPHQYLTRPFKIYYLIQLGFWIQQLLVIHIEKPRKDHWQMFAHHILTCTLILGSYITNFTRIGTAVLATMDIGDIFLSSAKCFNYLKWRRVCDITFVAFVAVWVYSRHYLYMLIFQSVYYEAPQVLDWTWDPSQGRYVSWSMWYLFLGLLGVLQIILIMWFILILRVIVKVVRGSSAEDSRSDDEEDDKVIDSDQHSDVVTHVSSSTPSNLISNSPLQSDVVHHRSVVDTPVDSTVSNVSNRRPFRRKV